MSFELLFRDNHSGLDTNQLAVFTAFTTAISTALHTADSFVQGPAGTGDDFSSALYLSIPPFPGPHSPAVLLSKITL